MKIYNPKVGELLKNSMSVMSGRKEGEGEELDILED
jgi:hypothetical protein